MSETAATPTATLAIGGNSKAEMPILSGSVGPDVVDIRKLYAYREVGTESRGS